MTREQIIKEIDKLETTIWMVKMADHLTSDDYDWIAEKNREIRKLEKKLETM